MSVKCKRRASSTDETAQNPRWRGIELPRNSVICVYLCASVVYFPRVKLFYTGPVVNAEMLVTMLERHGIAAAQSFVDSAAPDDGDLSRPAQVFVPEADYDRAHQLFFAEREDEL